MLTIFLYYEINLQHIIIIVLLFCVLFIGSKVFTLKTNVNFFKFLASVVSFSHKPSLPRMESISWCMFLVVLRVELIASITPANVTCGPYDAALTKPRLVVSHQAWKERTFTVTDEQNEVIYTVKETWLTRDIWGNFLSLFNIYEIFYRTVFISLLNGAPNKAIRYWLGIYNIKYARMSSYFIYSFFFVCVCVEERKRETERNKERERKRGKNKQKKFQNMYISIVSIFLCLSIFLSLPSSFLTFNNTINTSTPT